MRQQVIERAIVATLLACILVYGVTLRLEDPLSTRALGAEDPYTHVVFTKEWSEQGYFADSFHLGTTMYPPGMHAWLAAFVPFTGIELHEFARIAPAFFGALAIFGMFAVGLRLHGPAAGLGAAFVTAIIPEHIFRTELLFPTAFDLALLPLWFLAFHMALHGQRLAGGALFLFAAIPIAIMHPWAVPLFAVPLALYAGLRAMRGATAGSAEDADGRARPSGIPRSELRYGAGMLVVAVAFAMAFRWDESDTGFADFFSHAPGLGFLATTSIPGPVIFFGATVLLGALAMGAVWLLERAPSLPRFVGIALGLAILAAIPVLGRTPPEGVYYPDMIGALSIGLGLAGFAVALLRPSALGDLGLVVTAWLFPLTAIDIFQSEFWPQRTVAYLCIGVALLAGTLVGVLHELPARFARSERRRASVGLAALVALALLFAGTATAMPTDTYRWYRLYNEDDYAGFEEVIEIVERDPDSKVFVYGWQPGLMVKALSDPDHVWYSPKFFNEAAEREEDLPLVHGPAYVLVDKYTTRAADAGKADLSFLKDGSYRLVFQTESGSLKLYEVSK